MIKPVRVFYVIATESTEEHGKIKAFAAMFSCSSVDSVAILS
jgi:hypothetical protein